ncbi:MAG: SUMF1/EgtB/PvdO family nonheme iron enzyme [Anaerolineae bacterium]|jgi:hypothetical protein|nr:SUMF1/EgtB/PvdO family nonheme iron enzyme [Anaerolineae bacterium]
MSRIYVSYIHQDRRLLNQLLPVLYEWYGEHFVWYDQERKGGADWWQMITLQIKACEVFVWLITPKSFPNSYCLAELQEAARLGKRIIFVDTDLKLDVTQLSEHIQLDPESFVWVRLGDQMNSDRIQKLKSALQDQLKLYRPMQPLTSELTPEPTIYDRYPVQNVLIGCLVFLALIFSVYVVGFIIGMPLIFIVEAIETRFFQVTPVPRAVPVGGLENATNLQTNNDNWRTTSQSFQMDDMRILMVLVPVGCLSDNLDAPICIDTPFWLDKYEVSNAQFDALKGQASNASRWPDPNRPRETITWQEAHDFCLQRMGRLPTAIEWQYAARGPEAWLYPWGNDFSSDALIYSWNSNGQTAAWDRTRQYWESSWIGADDLSGNVAEWVNAGDDQMRLALGGAFNTTDERLLQPTAERWESPTFANETIGFRCARDL